MSEGDAAPQVVRRPLVAAATLFCLGALVDGADPAVAGAWLGGLAVLTVALARRRRILAALLAPWVFLAAGALVSAWRAPPVETLTEAGLDPTERRLVEGRVAEAPDWRDDGHTLVVDLVGTSTSPRVALTPVVGRVRLSVAGVGAPCGQAGDLVRAWARISPYAALDFPGGVGRRAAAARRGVSLRGRVSHPGDCVRLERGAGARGALERLRGRIQARLAAAAPGPDGGLIRALSIGDRSGLDEATQRAFRRSGLAHVLAVSGLHLSVVCGLLVLALTAAFRRAPRIALGIGAHRLAALVTLPVVALYTALVGASPSAVRAGLMVAALLCAHALSRLREAWSALALALLVMVAADPTALGDPGLQLSFAAVAALLRIQPALADRLAPNRWAWPAWRRAPVEAALASLAATIGTAPLVLRHFGVLPTAGLLTNALAAPWATIVVVPLSLLTGALAAVDPAWAEPILGLALGAAGVLRALAEGTAALPGSSVWLPQPTILECVLFYGATIGFSLPRYRRGMRRVAAVCLTLLVASLVGTHARRLLSDELVVTFLPVGQGDAAVVELPGGDVLVVDTGPSGPGGGAAARVVVPFLRHRRISRVRALVLTHPHDDHAGGVAALADAVGVDEVWWTADVREGPPALAAEVAGIGARRLTATDPPLTFGGAEVSVLGPVQPPAAYADVNDGSVVLAVRLGRRRILLPGDAEAAAEQDMLQRCAPCLEADVLKAGHHGSRSSTTQAFLRAVDPEHVVFCVGRHNRFGFPHPEVVERVRRFGARAWRTDTDGAVTVRTDGEALSVEGFLTADEGP